MSKTFTVLKGLAASFKQPTGRSRPGIDWAIEITGEPSGMVVVRTYFSTNPPQDVEKKELAEKAVRFVERKLELGWLPWPGVLEYEEEAG
jgi:hypothetical protein